MDISKIKVVEWSPSQKCFHVETIDRMIHSNLRVFFGHTMTDYLPIGIFDDEHEMDVFLEQAHKHAEG